MNAESRGNTVNGMGLTGSLLCTLLLTLPGCVSLGPGAIQGSRADYNIALRNTEDEQLLLNLVRLRYRDRLLFLEASSLTTQFRFGGSAGATYGYDSDARESNVIGGEVLIEEKPTVTYTPLQGKDFVERMLDRIPLESLVLLSSAGWSVDRVFRVCVERMNDLPNAQFSDGPTPRFAPEFERFTRATGLLRQLQVKDLFAGAQVPKERYTVLRFRTAARNQPEFLEFMKIMGLDPNREFYTIESTVDRQDGETLNLRTRSFSGIMYFLSQSVEVPAADVEAGRVTVTRDASGAPFDWARVTDGLMQVRASEVRPDNAAVAVFYRNSWFYIDDSDLESKSTFSMLAQIFAIQSGDVQSTAPVLTLPVGN